MVTVRNSRILWTIHAIILVCFCVSGCLEFKSIEQPSSVLSDETFTVLIEARPSFIALDRQEEGIPLLGICLPQGWKVVDNVIFCRGASEQTLHHSNIFSIYQGSIRYNTPNGYSWWVFIGLEEKPTDGSTYCEVHIQTDGKTGRFSIDYMLGCIYWDWTEGGFTVELNRERSDNHLIDVVDEHAPRDTKTLIEEGFVLLSWVSPVVTDGLEGYNIYRDGELINNNLLTETEYTDNIVSEGKYFYTISSIYETGDEYLTPYRINTDVFLSFQGGTGEPDDPYQVATPIQLLSIANDSNLWDKSFILVNDIDLETYLQGTVFEQAVIPVFSGIFDGNGYRILNLRIKGHDLLGLFGKLSTGAEVKNLGLVDTNIFSSGYGVGGLVGYNADGDVWACCNSSGQISGIEYVGGLIGENSNGNLVDCYNTATVTGDRFVGGLIGQHSGDAIYCYSTGIVKGYAYTGGLFGHCGGIDSIPGDPSHPVSPPIFSLGCFWDVNTSQKDYSSSGKGLTTSEMQTATTFIDAGWDFVDETVNGTKDIWWINEGQDYPRLWWELGDEASP